MMPLLLFAGLLGLTFVVLWFLIPKTPRKPRARVADDDPHRSKVRYERANTWPWLVMVLAGTKVLLFTAKICTVEPDGMSPSPLLAPLGGFGLSMLVAIGALAARSASRWPAAVIMACLVSQMFFAFHQPAHDEASHSDRFVLWMFFVMFFTSGYTLIRPTPRKPSD